MLGFLGKTPDLAEDLGFGPQTDRGPGLVTSGRANALANLVPPRLGKLKILRRGRHESLENLLA